jgi:ATP-dependent Clp protease ATP-binding subunit ClpC
MSSNVADPNELRGFDPPAKRAVAFADREARALGHDRVGTEHLFLGLLTNDSDASKVLTSAGVTLAASRKKVSEAVAKSSAGAPGQTGPLPRTARASRALGRAARFAHSAGSDIITSDHLLWGVLDVEGTAGQVLRGLGVDVDSLRERLEADTDSGADASSAHAVAEDSSAACPSCSVALEEHLTYRVMTATSESGTTRETVLFSCQNCGAVLGIAPA